MKICVCFLGLEVVILEKCLKRGRNKETKKQGNRNLSKFLSKLLLVSFQRVKLSTSISKIVVFGVQFTFQIIGLVSQFFVLSEFFFMRRGG